MKVLLADRDRKFRADLESRLRGLDGVSVTTLARDLTETYHAAEHRPHAVALISSNLARLPEFEVLMHLFRAVKTRVVVLFRTDIHPENLPLILRQGDVTLLPAKAPDAAFHAALSGPAVPAASQDHQRVRTPRATPVVASPAQTDRLILIGASTGGIDALIEVLGHFPAQCPPTMIVQHTGGAFTPGLVRLLNAKSPAHVIEARHNEVMSPGMVAVAPGDQHHLKLQVVGQKILSRLEPGPEVNGHRPSIDVMFHSAVARAAQVTAGLLTGMGRDGADGLLQLRKAGARTFGQDAATSLVYGMPRAAAEIGAVERQVPIDQMGATLLGAAARGHRP